MLLTSDGARLIVRPIGGGGGLASAKTLGELREDGTVVAGDAQGLGREGQQVR